MPGVVKYNASGTTVAGYSAIILPGDVLLESAAVTTIVGADTPKRDVYSFPGLSGAGSVFFGLGPRSITWDAQLIGSSGTNLEAFIGKLRAYAGRGVRARLETEWDNYYDYVELVRVVPAENPKPVMVGNAWVQRVRVEFEWMQPS